MSRCWSRRTSVLKTNGNHNVLFCYAAVFSTEMIVIDFVTVLWTRTLIAEHTAPAGPAVALPRTVARAVNAPRIRETLGAVLTPPANLAP